MTTPLNKDLQELRVALEHYKRVLKHDEELKSNGNPNNHRLLTNNDIDNINLKIKGINSSIEELLVNDNNYNL